MSAYYGIGYISHREQNTRSVTAERGRQDQRRRYRVSGNMRIQRPYLLLFMLITGILIGFYVDSVTAAASSAERPQVSADAEAATTTESTAGQSDSIYIDSSHQLESTHQSVDVQSGDTLWTIADAHKPDDIHIRGYIDQLKKLNGLTNSMLYEGMLLYLP